MTRVEASIKGTTRGEKSLIKSNEIVKATRRGEFTKGNVRVDIQSVREIDGGVEVMARAWRNGKQLGFGKDGSVDIERFRFFNPPVLVDDPAGDIVRSWKEKKQDGSLATRQRKLREDPEEALRQIVAQTVGLVGKDGKNIVPGKVGRTTSTFYPDANAESTSVDGHVGINNGNAAWATTHDATAGDEVSDSATTMKYQEQRDSGVGYRIFRIFMLFDTSALGSDTVSSAVLSAYGVSKTYQYTGAQAYAVIASAAPASNTALALGDYDQVGTTALSSTIAHGSIATSAYNDFTLNASGLAAVNGAGVSKFSMRGGYDFENVSVGTGFNINIVFFYSADQTGTTTDPKLVVEHEAVNTFVPRISFF